MVHHADAIVDCVAHEDVAGGILGNALWGLQTGAGGRTAITQKAAISVAGHGGDDLSGMVDPADAVLTLAGTGRGGAEHVGGAIHRHPGRRHAGAAGWPRVTGKVDNARAAY